MGKVETTGSIPRPDEGAERLARILLVLGSLATLVSYVLPWLQVQVLTLSRSATGLSLVSTMLDVLRAHLDSTPTNGQRDASFQVTLRVVFVFVALVAPGVTAANCLVVAARVRKSLRRLRLLIEVLTPPGLWLAVAVVASSRIERARREAGPFGGLIDVGTDAAADMVAVGVYVAIAGMALMVLAGVIAATLPRPASDESDSNATGAAPRSEPDAALDRRAVTSGAHDAARSEIAPEGQTPDARVVIAGAVGISVLALVGGLAVAGLTCSGANQAGTTRGSNPAPEDRVASAGSRAVRDPPAPQRRDNIRRITPVGVSASGYLSRNGRYPPERLFDGDLRTCWADGVAGLGIGEWVEADLGTTRTLRRVVLVPGYDKWHPRSGDLFFLNAQLRSFELRSDSGWSQISSAPRGVRRVTYDLGSVSVRRLRLTVRDAWPGTRWADLSVSEMELYGDSP